jgi:hypothetical protein
MRSTRRAWVVAVAVEATAFQEPGDPRGHALGDARDFGVIGGVAGAGSACRPRLR